VDIDDEEATGMNPQNSADPHSGPAGEPDKDVTGHFDDVPGYDPGRTSVARVLPSVERSPGNVPTSNQLPHIPPDVSQSLGPDITRQLVEGNSSPVEQAQDSAEAEGEINYTPAPGNTPNLALVPKVPETKKEPGFLAKVLDRLMTSEKNEAADPIDSGTGEFWHITTDASVVGVGLNFELRRIYRNRWNYDGPLGKNWTHSYDQRLIPGTSPCGLRHVDWLTGMGAMIRFEETYRGFETDPPSEYELVETQERGYKITLPTGEKLFFAEDGSQAPLQKIEDLNGNTLALTWTWVPVVRGSLSVPRLSVLTDTMGRMIEFHYDSHGLLEKVTVPGLGSSTYAYDSNGDLRTATTIGGRVEHYKYSEPVDSDPYFVPTPQLQSFCEAQCGLDDPSCPGIAGCDQRNFVHQCSSQCRIDCSAGCDEGCSTACRETGGFSNCKSSCVTGCDDPCAAVADENCHKAIEDDGVAQRACRLQCHNECYDQCQDNIYCEGGGLLVTACNGNCENNVSAEGWHDGYCEGWQECVSRGAISGQHPDGHVDTLEGLCLPGIDIGWCCNTDCFDCCLDGDCGGDVGCIWERHGGCEETCKRIFLSGRNFLASQCGGEDTPGCIDLVTQACVDGCGDACDPLCAEPCEDQCSAACRRDCDAGDRCRTECGRVDFEGVCKAGCVEECKETWAYAPGVVVYGDPSDSGHNLTSIENGAGLVYLQNSYETSITSPAFDRVIEQTFGGDIISYHHLDLKTPGAPPVRSEDAPYIQGATDTLRLCGKSCEGAGPRSPDRFVRVYENDYAVLDEPVGPEDPMGSFPVEVRDPRIDGYRWYEIQAGPSGPVIRPAISFAARGIEIQTPAGILSLSSVEGDLQLSGLPEDEESGILSSKDGVIFTLLNSARGWVAFKARARGAVRIEPFNSCLDEFAAVPLDSTSVALFPAGACSQQFHTRELGRRSEEVVAWAGALTDPRFDQTWLPEEQGARSYSRSPRRDPWNQPAQDWSDLCPPSFTAFPDQECIGSMGSFGPSGPPACDLPWFERGAGGGARPGPDAQDVSMGCGPELGTNPRLPPEPCAEERYTSRPVSGTFEDQPISRATVVRDGAGIIWTYFTNSEGAVLRTVNNSSGARTDRNYDALGRLRGETAAFGDRVCYDYDDHGNVINQTQIASADRWTSTPIVHHQTWYAEHARPLVAYEPSASERALRVATVWKYDDHANVIGVEQSSLGRVVEIVPDSRGRVSTVTDPSGSRTTINYHSGSGQWETMIRDHGGLSERTRTADRDPFGRILELREPASPTDSYQYAPDNRLLSQTVVMDPATSSAPITTLYWYDSAGDLARIIGREAATSIALNGRGLPMRVDVQALSGNHELRRTCYNYDRRGLLIESIDPEGRRVRYTRDANGQVVELRRGVVATTYGAWDDECESKLDDGTPAAMELFEKITRDDVLGGLPTSRTLGDPSDPVPFRSTFEYDGFGRLIETTLSNGVKYRSGYDELGRNRWSAAYVGEIAPLPAGLLNNEPDPNEPSLRSFSKREYDLLGRSTTQSTLRFFDSPNGREFLGSASGWSSTNVRYLDAEAAVEVTNPLSETTRLERDAFGRETAVYLPNDITIAYARTNHGRSVTRWTTPAATASGHLIEHLELTDFGAVKAIKDSANTAIQETVFDAYGRPVLIERQNGTERISYSPFNETTKVERVRANNVAETFVELEHTRTGVLERLRDGRGEETLRAYDSAGRLASETHSDGRLVSLSYRPRTHLVSQRTDRNGDATTIEYDAFMQARSIRGTRATAPSGWAGATDVAFERDVLGLVWARSINKPADGADDVLLSFRRDSTGRLVEERSSLFPNEPITYARDAVGRAISLRIGVENIDYRFDAVGRIDEVFRNDDLIADYTYSGIGMPSTITFGSGLVEQRTYDDRARLRTLRGFDGATERFGHELSYGADGTLSRLDQWMPTSATKTTSLFRSDDFGRIEATTLDAPNVPGMTSGLITHASLTTAMNAAGISESFSFDAADHISLKRANAQIVTPAIGADGRLTDFAGAIGSDFEANTTSIPGVADIAYDGLARPVQTTPSAGVGYSFAYDAFGRLASYSGPAGSGKYLYAENKIVRDVVGTSVRKNVSGPWMSPVAVVSGSTIHYNHSGYNDRLTFSTTKNRAVAEKYRYTVFGEPTVLAPNDAVRANSTTGNTLLFSGAPYFSNLGMYRLGQRWYRPTWGRFLTPDPMQFGDGPNQFGYVGAQPLAFVDPLGLARKQVLDNLLQSPTDGYSAEDYRWHGIGYAFGLAQGLIPAAVLADSPAAESQPFELGRARSLALVGAAQITVGLLTMKGGGGAAAVGLIAAPETAGTSLVVSGGGGLAMVSGAVVSVWGTTNVVAAGVAAEGLSNLGGSGPGSELEKLEGETGTSQGKTGQIHHVATDKSVKSGLTQKFEQIFERAGMSLQDPANKVFIEGHAGRHARSYHQYVLGRLQQATEGLTRTEAGVALRAELEAIKLEIFANPEILKGVGLP
jgi:RHS repeat-associated protein